MSSKLKYSSKAAYYGSGIQSVLLAISTSPLTKSQRKWRVACIVIYVSLSMAKRVVSRKGKKLSTPLLPPPHTSILEIKAVLDDVEDGQVMDQKRLAEMVKAKKLDGFGGIAAIAKLLATNTESGINGDEEELTRRRVAFGSNTYERAKPKGLIHFVVEAFRDTTILILLACAALSLAFGIREHGGKEGWYEGGSIFVAVFLVVAVSAASNFRQERQFDKLSKISNNIKIGVVRQGRRQHVSIFDAVVGDVVFLNTGDQVPADGVFVDGHSFQVDESSMTGESEHVEVDSRRNPFLLSGSKVADGYGKMVVVSVGMDTAWGEMMSSITRDSNEQTPLQERLNRLTSTIGKLGLAVAFFVLLVMLVRYFTGNTQDENGRKEFNGVDTDLNDNFNSVLRIVSAAVTIVVVAIPEGLPLAVTLTLAYSMKRMMADQAMVRKLSACETMGSATVICTDKTGTLTLNQMKVTKFCLGGHDIRQDSIAPNLLQLFYQGVAFNTTGSIYKPKSASAVEYSGSPTEKAILSWAVEDLGMDVEKLKQSYTVLHVETFNSDKKRSGVSLRNDVQNCSYVHWKGAAEMVLAMCSNYYQHTGEMKAMSKEKMSEFENIIQGMAASSLRCIAFACKQIEYEKESSTSNEITLSQKTLTEENLTLLGIVGMKDPCRSGAKKAIESCRFAGVDIKMITGDNIFTAKAIATECGILDPNQHVANGEVVEGIEFRNYTDEERRVKIKKIRVMARSSPLDKLLMVRCLKQAGEVVAVTGDGTNDAPALKEADVGLSMGIQGTEVAKESSDIVILDDNFSSVATVLLWGRCVYNNIQKFIQFQLTVNIAALVINFIAAVSAGDVPLTAVQLLWVNLIMDTLGALALATERPTKELMHRPPVGRTQPLITNIMWRNLLPQALYQISILLILQFRGRQIFQVNQQVKNTLIFNTFVLCQIFNEFNSRNLEKKNVFKGIHRNKLFVGIIAVTIVLQFVMVEFLKKFADTVSLSLGQWGICVVIAAVTWPIGWLMKFVPVTDKPFLDYLNLF
ncbi:calcium-transporting ATPase 12, plasma membrane-type [Salvia miltiorrhiza]|uniref:calcium-transporting ATPase 12, plasma membrane-type n=1 Tax=Salvia miltiorrhiza TaxID=226208 RepID=UPI0025AD2247|nr:calcium-transporting ATPase 12, plasma membrane-type [Salvia miltiorrhiza]